MSRTHLVSAGAPLAPRRAAPVALAVALAWGCGGGPPSGDGSGGAPPAGDRVGFVDRAAEAGLTLVTVCGDLDKRHLLESTGTGVAVADYDGDGDDDLYLATAQTTEDWMAGRKPRANALYRNDGDGTFTDVAAEAGVDLRAWSSGTYFSDYDNDGDKDLFVTTWGKNVLYRNEGDGTFTDVTAEAGVGGDEGDWSTSAAFSDLDRDGDLDLYVVNYCVYDLWNPPLGGTLNLWKGIATYPGPRGFIGQKDRLYRNDGGGRFVEISEASGIALEHPGYGLGVVVSDLDDDGDPDIYVANDSVPNHLWRNDGDLRFTDVGPYANVATNEDGREQAGMGTDAGDFDGDGRIDLIVTNFSHECNTMHRNQGGMFFTDATYEVGMRDSYLKLVWGAKFFDFDNDGWLDLMVANGHIYPEVDGHPRLNTSYRQRNTLYRNDPAAGTFEDVTEVAGPGLAIVESTRGLATVDLDRDGDLDVLLTNIDSTPNLLVNEGGDRGSWASFRLTGTVSNRDAVGARLTVVSGGVSRLREVNPFGSYQSQSTYEVHVGLGGADRVDRVRVAWPSGQVDEIGPLPARALYAITEGTGSAERVEPGGP